MDLVQVYIDKRDADLRSMIKVYFDAGQEPPIDILARIAELKRLESKLMEYRDAEEADA